MYSKSQKYKTKKLYKWFRRKIKRPEAFSLNEISDESEDEGDSIFAPSAEYPCTSNELRIFVGTWNVAGRSPVGSLAVDLGEWLNLRDAADMYVLGFQEIVPLKTRTVIGAEDPTEAKNWNLLIGKTLNNKFGGPWLTPMKNPISSDNYHYVKNPDAQRRASFSGQSRVLIKDVLGSSDDDLHGGSKYTLMASKKMVGVFISVWMKTELLRKYCVSNVKVSSVACGIMGYLGNKGSVSVSMSIEGTSFCFVDAHLASGEKNGDEERRNHQVSEIFRRTSFPRSPKDDYVYNPHPLTILGHDRIFWFGDLNYRLYLQDNLARCLIKQQDWKSLQEFDQLRKELEDGGVFQGWREGNIEFAPTYKYSSLNCNRYSGGLPNRTGEKQRTPAWCDRILWYGKGVKQLSYFRSESKFSDHRPVSALFSIPVEVIMPRSSKVVPMNTVLSGISPLSEKQEAKSINETKLTLSAMMENDDQASPTDVQTMEETENSKCI